MQGEPEALTLSEGEVEGVTLREGVTLALAVGEALDEPGVMLLLAVREALGETLAEMLALALGEREMQAQTVLG